MSSVVELKPNEIPSDWKKMGARNDYSPTPPEKLRMYLVSKPGVGKTTLIASIPRCLHLDFDKTANNVKDGRANYIPIENYSHYKAILELLIANAKVNKRVFERVAFDTSDTWSEIVGNEIIRNENDKRRASDRTPLDYIGEFGREGHGWGVLRARMLRHLKLLEDAGYSWAVAGHVGEKEITTGGEKRTVLRASVFPSMDKALAQRCDMKGSIYRLVEKKQVFKTVKIGKQKKRVPAGETETETYVLTLRGGGDEKRRLSGMKLRLELPEKNGYAVFKDEYVRAMDDTEAGT